MRVTVEIGGMIRRPEGQPRVTKEMPDGSTARGLLTALGYSEGEQRALRLCRDDGFLHPSSALVDGDTLTLFAAVGGG